MKDLLDKIKSIVRGIMYEVAKLLDFISNGFIEPKHITFVSVIGHVVILLALTEGSLISAAIMLASFGLLDALDGAVAKFQGTASFQGMLLDSTTDRIKETLLYAGLAYYFAINDESIGALYSALALGLSISVSYVKSKGETAILADKDDDSDDINREFEDGIFGYEVRMFIIFVSLLFQDPFYGVAIVAGGAALTYITRFNSVVRRLEK